MSQRPTAGLPAGRLRFAAYPRLGSGPGNGQGDIWGVDGAVIADLMPR